MKSARFTACFDNTEAIIWLCSYLVNLKAPEPTDQHVGLNHDHLQTLRTIQNIGFGHEKWTYLIRDSQRFFLLLKPGRDNSLSWATQTWQKNIPPLRSLRSTENLGLVNKFYPNRVLRLRSHTMDWWVLVLNEFIFDQVRLKSKLSVSKTIHMAPHSRSAEKVASSANSACTDVFSAAQQASAFACTKPSRPGSSLAQHAQHSLSRAQRWRSVPFPWELAHGIRRLGSPSASTALFLILKVLTSTELDQK
jgi:hypothetical protein